MSQIKPLSPRSIDRPNVKPVELAHIFFRTKRFRQMVDFYCKVLNAHVAHGTDNLAFLTYDDENHRIAIAEMPGLQDPDPSASGLEHFSYTYASFGDLLANYERLKVNGILPFWCINHGANTSIYYYDPDGNQLETQVDNFDTPEDLAAFLHTPEFAANPIGVQFDPDRMVERYLAGDSESELKLQGAAPRDPGTEHDWSAPRGVADAVLRDLETARCQALLDGDLETVEAMLSDDLVHIHGNGVVDSKAGYMQGLREKYIFHELSRPDLHVRVFGNTAIMTGPLRQSFSARGSEARHDAEGVSTQTWIRAEGRWRLASCHNSFQRMDLRN